MNTSRTRLLAVTAATLTLVAGASAVVSAHPGDEPLGFGRDGFGGRLELRGLGGWLGGDDAGFVRQETTIETDDGLVTRRVDDGTLASSSDSSVDYTLVDGQSVSATIDEDTEVLSFDEELVDLGRGGLMRRQLSAESVSPSEIAAGSEILVWSESQADGTYLAQRIVVQPESTTDDAATSESDSDAVGTSADASPAASPASA